jgi:hypothetical protein
MGVNIQTRSRTWATKQATNSHLYLEVLVLRIRFSFAVPFLAYVFARIDVSFTGKPRILFRNRLGIARRRLTQLRCKNCRARPTSVGYLAPFRRETL